MQNDDLSIDELLEAVSKKPIPRGYEPIQYEEVKASIICLGCNTLYEGIMTKVVGMDNLYDNYESKWCPRCISQQEDIWFQHCFRMKSVVAKPFKI